MTRNQRRSNPTWHRLLGLAIEIPPAAYVAITGTAPTWVRIWFVTWLSFWLIATVITAAKANGQQNEPATTAQRARTYR